MSLSFDIQLLEWSVQIEKIKLGNNVIMSD